MREVSRGLTNILAAGTYIKGNLRADAGIRIDGMIEGEVIVNDTFVLGKTGVVKGTIQTKDALIGGKVIGGIKSQGKIELKTGSVVNGDIICKRLSVENGAIFDGFCKMSGEKLNTVKKDVPAGKQVVG